MLHSRRTDTERKTEGGQQEGGWERGGREKSTRTPQARWSLLLPNLGNKTVRRGGNRIIFVLQGSMSSGCGLVKVTMHVRRRAWTMLRCGCVTFAMEEEP